VIAALWTGPSQLTTAAECVQITGLVREPLPLADRTVPGLEDLAAFQPLLIAINDLQWADRVSRFLSRSLVSGLAGLSAVWMFASRDDPTGTDLADHDHVGIERIQLAPLATTAEPDRLGSSHRRARRHRA
jgi:hypothetical protein